MAMSPNAKGYKKPMSEIDMARCEREYKRIKRIFPDTPLWLGYFDFSHGCGINIGTYGFRIFHTSKPPSPNLREQAALAVRRIQEKMANEHT